MNTTTFAKSTFFAFLLGLIVSIIGGYLYFGSEGILPQASAEKYILYDNDIYLASELAGSKRITTNGDIKYLYGHENNLLLLGKQKGKPVPASEDIGYTNLYLHKIDSKEEELISDEPIQSAFFNKHNKNQIIFVTTSAETKMYDLESKKIKKLAEKSLNPNVNNASTKVVYKKLSPNWLPGEYLDGSLGLYVTDIQTGQENQLTSGEMDYAPLWSPNGKYVIFYSNNPEGLNSLFAVNNDGSDLVQLSNIGETFVSDKTVDSPSELPIWSNDGKYIVYESDRRIWVNELDLDNKKLISAKAIAYGVSPEWVEDGKTISVVTTKASEKSSAITVMDLEGNIIRNKQ